jgi:type IV pilus assembly protein PilC
MLSLKGKKTSKDKNNVDNKTETTKTPEQQTLDGNSTVNYNNTMSGSTSTTQQANVELPDDPSVITDRREKIKRPTIDYRYTIINGVGKKEQGTFEAESENDVRNFLLAQDYQVLEVKERSKFDIDVGANRKMGASDLSFSLTQLSTYIKSGIPLADSVKILAKQTKKQSLKKSFNQLVYQLLKGESLSDAMSMQGNIYPKLLINMVKTAEMTGDLPSILDDMSEYYTSMDQTHKQMKSAMTYPIVVLTIAFGVLIFMLTYLVPQFSSMFEENGATMPALTLAILALSEFIKTNWLYLILGVVLIIFTFIELYKKVKKFRETVQIILMHTPIFKNIIIYNEIANFTKTFASLLNHGVFITDSMEILSKITNNEVYKRIINKTLENLGKGDSISSAFKGEWAIPVVAYEMIVTGETTGQLGNMMEKVAGHFQMLHKNVIDQMKSLVEPLLICFLAVVVGVILVSIIQPMFSIYSQIS